MPYLAETLLTPTETSKKVKFLKKKEQIKIRTKYSSRRVRRNGGGWKGGGGGAEEGWWDREPF